jgi:hypothetical protein
VDFISNPHVSFGLSTDYYMAAKNSGSGHELHVFAAAFKLGFWAVPAQSQKTAEALIVK